MAQPVMLYQKAKLADLAWRDGSPSGNHQRAGQRLFNILPNDVSSVIVGTEFDPFYKTFHTVGEIYDWIDQHLIFGELGGIIGVFNGDDILWEK